MILFGWLICVVFQRSVSSYLLLYEKINSVVNGLSDALSTVNTSDACSTCLTSLTYMHITLSIYYYIIHNVLYI